MEFVDDSFDQSSSSSNRNGKVHEPGELLESSWFFGNLLDKKPNIMSRCYSHPCPSSDYKQEILVKKSSMPRGDEFVTPKLMIPPCISREGNENLGKESEFGVKKSILQLSRNNLVRAPSLPPCMGREEIQDLESDFTMSKLIRQASLNHSDTSFMRNSTKGMNQSSSIQRHGLRKKQELESINIGSCKEFRRPYLMDQRKIRRKSQSDLESEEVQGFRDLGFTFDHKEELNQSVIQILPGLQEKSERIEQVEEEAVQRPYLSEAWMVQNSAAPVPNWGGKRSAENMKEQIKFWARAVASNAR